MSPVVVRGWDMIPRPRVRNSQDQQLPGGPCSYGIHDPGRCGGQEDAHPAEATQ